MLFVFAVCGASVVGCGSHPIVERIQTAPEAKSVTRWKLTWEGNISQVGRFGQSSGGVHTLSASSADSLTSHFVDEICVILRNEYRVEFFDNPPFDGTIKIDLSGQKKALPGDQLEYSRTESQDEIDIAGRREKTVNIDVRHHANLDDRIEGVRVTLMNDAGQLLGNAAIYYDQSIRTKPARIKPSDVAKVIAEMLH